MWLTKMHAISETMEAERRGLPDRKMITKLQVSGVGYLDKVASAQPIQDFRNRLRESEWFSDRTEISRQPSPQKGDYLREYDLVIVLERPIPE
jgi:hypothetical protein